MLGCMRSESPADTLVERQRLEAAIAAIDAQRGLLGDAVADVAVAPLVARLAALTAHEQTLRQVTILFLDVVGSTSIGQHLDPEDISTLMDGALAGCTRIVAAHQGKVLQYAGDSLLAVFGSEQAREDDAERAVRAGLALLEEGRRLAAAVQQERGIAGFDVRIGVHTGAVLLGGGVDAEGTIRGIAVNIAARLEQTAPAGAMRISRDTYRQVRGLFEVEALPALQVKGIDAPMASFRVLRARPRSFGPDAREAERGGAGLVGRDAEMARLLGLVEEARASRSLRWITLAADAGVGKSRLLRELERRLNLPGAGVTLLHGRAQRYGLHVLHGVARDLVAWHCGIADSDTPETARAKLQSVFGVGFGGRSEEQSALVGQLVGFDFSAHPTIAGIAADGRQIRARAFHAIAEFLRLQCAGPGAVVTVLLDDLHWADDGSLDLVEYLVAHCSDLPLLLACFARPPLFERRPAWRAPAAPATHLALEPLGAESSGRLADALLAGFAEPPPELRALLLQSAEGNPFHLEEVLGMLIDEGVIAVTPEGWQADAARLGRMRVPTTLTAVLQARLDALPAAEKLALQRESVIGHVFWDDALQRIAPDSLPALAGLAARELIAQRASSAFAGMREYAFKHHLLHQVTYDTVLKPARRELHRLTADWLVATTGDRIGEHLGLVAEHYERAGDAAQAAAWLQRAADAAFRAASYADTLGYLDRALALLPADAHRARYEAEYLRASVFNSTGRRVELVQVIGLLDGHAEALEDDALRARATAFRAMASVIAGRSHEAIVDLDRAIALAERSGAATTVAAALVDKGHVLTMLRDFDGADRCLKAGLAQARSLGMTVQEIMALNRLNAIALLRGDLAGALVYLEPAIAAARATGHRRFEGGLLSNLGAGELAMGLVDEAAAHVEAGLAISREIGDRGSVPYALEALAHITLARGDADAALALALEGMAAARAAGDAAVEAYNALVAGRCHAALGDAAAAAAAFDRHDATRAKDNAEVATLTSTPPRIALALSQGRVDDAAALAAKVVAWLDAKAGGPTIEDLERCFECHRALAAAHAARADEFLAHAHRLLIAQADRFDGALRDAFLGRVPLHREVLAAWTGRPGAGDR